MALFQRKKQNLHWYNLNNLSKFRLISGLIAGLLFAFSMYALLYMSRESIRILSYSPIHKDLWVLSDETVNFYNLFFAFVSVISGLSVCFDIWFNRPKKMFEHKNTGIINFLTDQAYIKWILFFILMSIFRSVGIFFVNAYKFGYRDFHLYPDYKYLFYLIIVAYFTHIMLNFRPKFSRYSIKFISISLISVLLLSWGLSEINIIDYQKINQILLNNNLYVKYHFELPEVTYAKKGPRYAPFYSIIVLNTTGKPEYIFDDKPVSLKDLHKAVNKIIKHYKDKSFLPYFNLLIDKSVKIQHINNLKSVFQNANYKRIIFNVWTENDDYAKRMSLEKGLIVPQAHIFSDNLSLVKKIKDTDSLSQIVSLIILSNGQLLIQDTLQESRVQILNKLGNLISRNPHTYFILKTDKQSQYDAYAKVLSAYTYSLDSLRKDYFNKHPGRNYFRLITGKENIYPYLLFDLIK